MGLDETELEVSETSLAPGSNGFTSGEEDSMVSVSTGCFHVSPTTRRGKRLQLLQLMLLPFIPIVALVVQNCLVMNEAIGSQKEAIVIQHQVITIQHEPRTNPFERLSLSLRLI